MRTLGSTEFAKRCGRLAEASVRFKVSQQTISNWRAGKRHPDEKHQITIESELGIPRAWWAMDPPAGPDAPEPSEPATLAEARATHREDLASAQRLIRAGLLEAQGEPDLARRANILTKLTQALGVTSKMAGSSAELTPEQVMLSPAWDQVEAATIGALEAWPDALESVAGAWERLAGA